MSKNWFITGTSRGFGRAFARAAASRGDNVVATARDAAALDDLVAEFGPRVTALSLDVTDRSAVIDAVEAARRAYGRIDVVVNNAGYGLFGAVEELTEADVRAQLETNLFGALWVTQGVLPVLREQGNGHIVQISSIGGVAAFPNLGGYHASKWALEGLSESLAQEVARFGVHVTLVEPGGYATDWSGSSATHAAPLGAYDPMREEMKARRSAADPGDPDSAAKALLRIVDAEQPPLRVLFGGSALGAATAMHERRIAQWRDWSEVSNLA
jgi:NAD(P)-dependent dehydrogenase (short-subunit alcohol dehydrogenase family)